MPSLDRLHSDRRQFTWRKLENCWFRLTSLVLASCDVMVSTLESTSSTLVFRSSTLHLTHVTRPTSADDNDDDNDDDDDDDDDNNNDNNNNSYNQPQCLRSMLFY